MSDVDEEALAWAGDNDERLTTGSTSKSPVRKRRASPSPSPLSSTSPSPDVSVQQPVEESGEKDAPGGLSSREGIMLGVLGGFYILFSAAWIVMALRNPVQIADPLGSFMFVAGLWMAALAPAAWFAAVLFFGRRRAFLWRLTFLALGAVVVIPWPYFSWAS